MFEHEQQDVIDLHQLFWCLVTVRSLYELLSWYQKGKQDQSLQRDCTVARQQTIHA